MSIPLPAASTPAAQCRELARAVEAHACPDHELWGAFLAWYEAQDVGLRCEALSVAARLARRHAPALAFLIGQLGSTESVDLNAGDAHGGALPVSIGESARDRLESLGPLAAPSLCHALRSTSAWTRLHAAQALGAIGEAEAPTVESLLDLADDGDGRVRTAAGLALGRLGARHPAVAARLLEDLASPSAQQRLRAVLALGSFPTEVVAGAVPRLLGLALDPSPEVRCLALNRLRRVPCPEPLQQEQVRVLLAALECGVSDVQEQATALLETCRSLDPALAPALLRRARDRDPRIRGLALRALRFQDPRLVEPLLPELLALLVDPAFAHQGDVFMVLEKLGPRACGAVPVVLENLASAPVRDLVAALDALAAFGSREPAALDAVRSRLQHPHDLVRGAAQRALQALSSSE